MEPATQPTTTAAVEQRPPPASQPDGGGALRLTMLLMPLVAIPVAYLGFRMRQAEVRLEDLERATADLAAKQRRQAEAPARIYDEFVAMRRELQPDDREEHKEEEEEEEDGDDVRIEEVNDEEGEEEEEEEEEAPPPGDK